MSEYRETASDVVVRVADGAFIPNDPTNKDRIEFEKFLAAGGVPSPYEEPPPQTISRRQFFQQAVVAGLATEAEALAAVAAGAIPSRLQGIIDSLPAAQQFGARMLIAGAASFDRDHPLTLAIAAAPSINMTAVQMDAFWQAAAAL